MKYEGMVFKTNNCGSLVVIKYINSRNTLVKFIDTGYECIVDMRNIKSGEVKDKLLPSVQGVGILGDAPVRENGQLLKEYKLWQDMLKRCYDSKFHDTRPTYKDCSVSNNFKYYSYFKEWCNKQIGFAQDGFDLDKDILSRGNKVYSEDTCCFVPKEINNSFTVSTDQSSNYYVGVSYNKNCGKFYSRLNKFGKQNFLGYFDTEWEALNAYKEAKEIYAKELAEKWKDYIDPRVYETLMKYKINLCR